MACGTLLISTQGTCATNVAEVLGKLLTLGGMLTIGQWNDAANEEVQYDTRSNQERDELVSDVSKAGAAAAIISLYEWQFGNPQNIPNVLTQIGLVTGAHTLVNNDIVANLLRKVPFIQGLLTDPQYQDGKERSGLGRLTRCLLAYFALRYGAQSLGLPVTVS